MLGYKRIILSVFSSLSIGIFCSLYPATIFSQNTLANLPLSFKENSGQWDSAIFYKGFSPGWNTSIFFMKDRLSFSIYKQREGKKNEADRASQNEYEYLAWSLHFINANPHSHISAKHEMESKTNYLVGSNMDKHIRDIKDYTQIQYNSIYKNIDVRYYGTENKLKYDYILHPQSSINDIQIQAEGVKELSINKNGQLEIQTLWGTLIEDIPESYQVINEKIIPVKVNYKLLSPNTVGFSVQGEYNRQYDLVIDPITLAWSTFVGGNSPSVGQINDVQTDNAGNIYCVGTYPNLFPTTAGSYDPTHNGGGGGGWEAFVFKMDPMGSSLIYSTYIGGALNTDFGTSLEVNSLGEVYVTGDTRSTDFPVTAGAYDTSHNGGIDSYLFKLNAAGTALIYSTFIGGTNNESATDIELSNTGEAFVTGSTESSNFPATAGAYDISFNGLDDIFISKLNASGTSLLYSTFIGGSREEHSRSMALNASGEVFITGQTRSALFSAITFPVTPGAYDTSYNSTTGGSTDAFASKLNASGSALVYSTFLGGTSLDHAFVIKTNALNEAIIGGFTESNDFPVTSGAFDTQYSSSGTICVMDLFISKLDASGSSLLFSTFLGGANCEGMNDIEITPSGDFFVSGSTNSADFPVTSCAYDIVLNNSGPYGTTNDPHDIFLCKFDANATTLLYSTFIGGINSEGVDIVLSGDCKEEIIAAGASQSSDFPTTPGAFQSTKLNGSAIGIYQPIVFKIKPVINPDFSYSSSPSCNVPVAFTDLTTGNCIWQNSAWTPSGWLWDFGDGASSTLPNPSHTYTTPGTYNVKLIINCPKDSVTKSISIGGSCVFTVAVTDYSICPGTCTTLSASPSGGTGPYTYSWSNGATGTNINVCPPSGLTTNYTVTVTDSQGNTATDVASVQVYSPIVIYSSHQDVTCYGGSDGTASVSLVLLGAGGPYSYVWNPGGYTGVFPPGGSATGLLAGTYTVTATDVAGCTGTSTETVIEPSAVTANTNSTNASCGSSDGSVSVSGGGGTPGYSYNWSSAHTTSSASNLPGGIYSVTVTDSKGCTIIKPAVINTTPSASVTTTSSAANCQGSSTGIMTATVSGGSSPYTYNWLPAGTTGISIGTLTINNQPAGNYILVVTDNGGCVNSQTITITEPSQITPTLTATNTSCGNSNGSIVATASGGTPGYSYSWSALGGGTGITGSSLTGLSAGSYTVDITDANNCTLSQSITVNNGAAAVNSTQILTQCDSAFINSNWYYISQTIKDTLANAASNGCDSIITSTLTITNDISTFGFANICTGQSVLIHGTSQNTSGVYTQTFTAVSNGCDSISSITLNIVSAIINNLTPSICTGDSIFTGDSWKKIVGTYSDTLTGASMGGCDSIVNTTLTVGTASTNNMLASACMGDSVFAAGAWQKTPGIYSSTLVGSSGCDSIVNMTLTINTAPTVDAGRDTTIVAGQNITLSAAGTGTYSWSTGETTIAINQQPTTTTTYIVITTDPNGCTAMDSVIVFVENLCDDNTEIFVPNSFSPNGDGQNDVLQLYSTGTPETIYFTIYNRWGEKIFETDNLNASWNGEHRKKPADTGVYVWILKISCKGKTEEIIKKGNISLLR